jgi:CBS domain-containing protein
VRHPARVLDQRLDAAQRLAQREQLRAVAHLDRRLLAALELLQEREVNQLPVVEEDGRTVVGLLTRAGILRLVDTRLKLGV